MMKMQTNVNNVGMVEIPKLMCFKLDWKEKMQIYVYAKNGTVFLAREGGAELANATLQTLDEFNRLLIPTDVRVAAKVKKDSTVTICLQEENRLMHIEP